MFELTLQLTQALNLGSFCFSLLIIWNYRTVLLDVVHSAAFVGPVLLSLDPVLSFSFSPSLSFLYFFYPLGRELMDVPGIDTDSICNPKNPVFTSPSNAKDIYSRKQDGRSLWLKDDTWNEYLLLFHFSWILGPQFSCDNSMMPGFGLKETPSEFLCYLLAFWP